MTEVLEEDFDFDAVFDVDDYLFFYRDTLTEEVSQRQVDFLVEALDLDEPCDILDLACGFGRHANRLAALGHRVTGIDRSQGFLDLARSESVEKGLAVFYRRDDMRRLSDVAAYDCVLLLFSAFGYFSDWVNQQVVLQVARALKPGGRFVFDVPNRDVILASRLPCIVTDKDGDLMIDRNSFDSLSGRMTNRRIVIRNGVRKDKPFSIRLYNPSEVKALLAAAGLSLEKTFGGYDGSPISTESRRMVIIAKKTA